MNDLNFEQTDDRFHQSVVIGVTDAANRRGDLRLGQSFGVLYRQILGCRVALKSETRRVRGYFLPLIMRFDCHRAYAFRALPGDVIDRGKQTWLLIEGAQ